MLHKQHKNKLQHKAAEVGNHFYLRRNAIYLSGSHGLCERMAKTLRHQYRKPKLFVDKTNRLLKAAVDLHHIKLPIILFFTNCFIKKTKL